MENSVAEKMLKLVTDELKETRSQMKEMDRMYISKQKQVRQLVKAQAELQELASQG